MLTPRDNYFNYVEGREFEWIPSSYDQQIFMPELIPDNVCRGFINQQKPFDRSKFGGYDWFGVKWVFHPEAAGMGGSMEEKPLFEDVQDWKEYVKVPDLSKLDWEKSAEENKDYLNTNKIISTTIFTGFFERLISFVGFENALMALIDEDDKECVKEIFDTLCDFYIELSGYMKKYYNIELIDFHDDWGAQNSPFFSEETHSEMIVPYMKKLVNGAGKNGVKIEMHSCGKIERLIPNMISTGVVTWRGQSINDKKMLVDKYGDQFTFKVFVSEELSDGYEEVMGHIAEVLRDYKGKKIIIDCPRWLKEDERNKIGEYLRTVNWFK